MSEQTLLDRVGYLTQQLDLKDDQILDLKQALLDKQDLLRKTLSESSKLKEQLKQNEQKTKRFQADFDNLKKEIEQQSKAILVSNTKKKVFQDEVLALQKDIKAKQIELEVSEQALKAVKDENVTIRLQLLDPSNLKRDKRYNIESAEQGREQLQTLEENERVQKIYDSVMLQEELKHVFQENIRFRAKIKDVEDSYKAQMQEKAAVYKKSEAAFLKKTDAHMKVFEAKVNDLTQQRDQANELSAKNARFQKQQIKKLKDQIATLQSTIEDQKIQIERQDRRLKLHELENTRQVVKTSPTPKKELQVSRKAYQSVEASRDDTSLSPRYNRRQLNQGLQPQSLGLSKSSAQVIRREAKALKQALDSQEVPLRNLKVTPHRAKRLQDIRSVEKQRSRSKSKGLASPNQKKSLSRKRQQVVVNEQDHILEPNVDLFQSISGSSKKSHKSIIDGQTLAGEHLDGREHQSPTFQRTLFGSEPEIHKEQKQRQDEIFEKAMRLQAEQARELDGEGMFQERRVELPNFDVIDPQQQM